MVTRFAGLLLITLVVSSCNEAQKNEATPAGFPSLPRNAYNYGYADDQSNQITTIGRVLFYDKSLSIDNTVSCGSCHKQANSFADNTRFSLGISNNLTGRNTMGLANISSLIQPPDSSAGYGSSSGQFIGIYFWDGRASALQSAVSKPILNHLEMGFNDLSQLTAKIKDKPYYVQAFAEAYKTYELSEDKITYSLMLFLSSMRVMNSRNDKDNMYNGMAPNVLTDQEREGKGLFSGKYNCNSCHQTDSPWRVEAKFADIGLESNYEDGGLSRTTGAAGDIGKFRVPDLHNVELTAPYMHDGRFNTLEEVVNHYSDNILASPNLHADLKDEYGQPKRMNISQHDSDAIVAFLKTLTDNSITTDPRFSDPFATKN
jgi:cytochrome c peroxidase